MKEGKGPVGAREVRSPHWARKASQRLVGLLILVLALWWADPYKVWGVLKTLKLPWLLAALLCTIPTAFAMSLRFVMVGRELGAPLPLSSALSDTYLGRFANQLLPTGLAGSALRTMRHARRKAKKDAVEYGTAHALRCVVVDRLFGLQALALGSLASSLYFVAIGEKRVAMYAFLGIVLLSLSTALVLRVVGYKAKLGSELWNDLKGIWQAIGRRSSATQVLTLSIVSVSFLSLEFYFVVRASGEELALLPSLLLTPILLGSMVLPFSVAGLGIREAVAGAIFIALGLSSASGVGISLVFGAVGLVSALPGLLVWLGAMRNSG